MIKTKPKLLSLLVFLLVHQTRSALQSIVLSNVDSFVVERRPGNEPDLFTVNMKSNHPCVRTEDGAVSDLCSSLGGYFYPSTWDNRSSCSCTCAYRSPSFISSRPKCINAILAARFGGSNYCQGYFDSSSLLSSPVDFNVTDTKTFSVSKAESCTLGRSYFVHDYSGFRSRWETVNINRLFFLVLHNSGQSFQITWQSDTNGVLSGRIIRLAVTCSSKNKQLSTSFTSCILFKGQGTVTYSAPPVRFTTNTSHTSISNPPVVPSISVTSSLVTKSSSLSLSLTVSPSSSSQTLSASLPPSTTDRSSSTPSSSSFAYQPPSSSVSSLSSTLSPSPSLVLTSSTGTLGVPQSDSLFLPLTQSQTARLPVINTGQIQATTSAVIVPIEPAETTAAVSSSFAADGGPGNRGTQTGGNDNEVVIGAAVGGAVFVGILVIIVIVFWKRSKACESTEKHTKPVKNPVYGSSENAIQLEAPKGSKTIRSITQGDQPTYQSLINDNGKSNEAAIYSSADDEYDNCTVHVYQSLDKQIPGTPVYGRLNKGLPEPSHTTGEPKPKPKAKTSAAGIPNFEANGVTGLPKPKPTTTGKPSNRPIIAHENACNVIDGPGTGQGTTPEPMYNVLKVTDNPAYEQTLAFDAPYAALHGPGMQRESVYEPRDLGKTCKNPLYESVDQSDNQHSAC